MLFPLPDVKQCSFVAKVGTSGHRCTHAVVILDHYCRAWKRIIDQPWTIMSIGRRDWAHQ